MLPNCAVVTAFRIVFVYLKVYFDRERLHRLLHLLNANINSQFNKYCFFPQFIVAFFHVG